MLLNGVMTTKKGSDHSTHSDKAIERLIDSNIKVQHKMTDVMLSVKDLNENVSSLVHIFKKAGEHIKSGKYEDPMINKINDLLDQNKNLQRAIMLLEKYVNEKSVPRSSVLESKRPF
jgi:hypothetical protein